MALRIDGVPAELARRASAIGDLGAVARQRKHLFARGKQANRLEVVIERLSRIVLVVLIPRVELGDLEEEQIAFAVVAEREPARSPSGIERLLESEIVVVEVGPGLERHVREELQDRGGEQLH